VLALFRRETYETHSADSGKRGAAGGGKQGRLTAKPSVWKGRFLKRRLFSASFAEVHLGPDNQGKPWARPEEAFWSQISRFGIELFPRPREHVLWDGKNRSQSVPLIRRPQRAGKTSSAETRGGQGGGDHLLGLH